MSIPVWKMNPHKRGDTWDAIPVTISQNLTGCSMELAFRLREDGEVTKLFSTADGTIVINSVGANSTFTLQAFTCFMLIGVHTAELIITYPGGRTKTRLNVTWEITK